MPVEPDCELELSTAELDYFLENGEMPTDMETALETMLKLALRLKRTVFCKFTVAYEPASTDESSEDN